MKTLMPKAESIQRKWYVVDASGAVLGRLASKVAAVLRGKHKTIFTPHLDTGDFVIVVNAEKVRLTGKKSEKKVYQSHSHYPGGFKEEKFDHLMKRAPEKAVIMAVQGMIPKTKLGDKIMKKLKVYKGPEHPHGVHKPEVLKY